MAMLNNQRVSVDVSRLLLLWNFINFIGGMVFNGVGWVMGFGCDNWCATVLGMFRFKVSCLRTTKMLAMRRN